MVSKTAVVLWLLTDYTKSIRHMCVMDSLVIYNHTIRVPVCWLSETIFLIKIQLKNDIVVYKNVHCFWRPLKCLKTRLLLLIVSAWCQSAVGVKEKQTIVDNRNTCLVIGVFRIALLVYGKQWHNHGKLSTTSKLTECRILHLINPCNERVIQIIEFKSNILNLIWLALLILFLYR